MGDASSDGIAINAGTVSVAGSAGDVGSGVGSDARGVSGAMPVAGYRSGLYRPWQLRCGNYGGGR